MASEHAADPVVGWYVLLREPDGSLAVDWSGELHLDLADAERDADRAAGAGYTALVVALVPCGPELPGRPDLAEAPINDDGEAD